MLYARFSRIMISLVLGLVLSAAAKAQSPAADARPTIYRVIFPHLLFRPERQNLVQAPSVQEELRLTDDQRERLVSIKQRFTAKMHDIRQIANRKKAVAARLAARAQSDAEFEGELEPGQRARLSQIQLQAQGPIAFARDDLAGQLKLSESQSARVQALVDEWRKAVMDATQAALPPMADVPSSLEAVRALVQSEAFRSARQTARRKLVESWASSIRQIEQELSESQRSEYHKRLGEPFDLVKLLPSDKETDDIALVAGSLGLNGQRADPDFDVTVKRPAYAERHPSVLFDEAHHNFHTAGGRYKAFANLITNDGYRVTSNRQELTHDALAGNDVFVVANAQAEPAESGDTATSAFTASECDAVEEWVKRGGSLLLITDHEPFGSASEALGKRFGVEMSLRVTVDPANATTHGLLFSRAKNQLGDHPIMNGRDESERVNRVLTFTGQSLKGPAGSLALLTFSDTATEGDEAGEVSAAGRAQGIALAYGKGRVVVLGEAAQLSAQVYGLPPEPMGMNVPGCDNRQMALNLMHWLSGLID